MSNDLCNITAYCFGLSVSEPIQQLIPLCRRERERERQTDRDIISSSDMHVLKARRKMTVKIVLIPDEKEVSSKKTGICSLWMKMLSSWIRLLDT